MAGDECVKLFALLLSSAALAGTTTTEGPPSYELHEMPANTIVSPWPKTEKECVDRATASLGKWQCVTRRNFETVGSCADVPKPAFPAVVKDGFLQKPALRVPVNADGSWGSTEMEGYVAAPYPACWVMGWVPYVQEIEPPHADINEPVSLTPQLQAAWDASCAERHAAHVFYDGDACP